jgi:GxxExxY protein
MVDIPAELSRTIHGTKPTLLFPEESFTIRGACFHLYKKFRNTQKESVYQKSLKEELFAQGLDVQREKQLPIYYRGVKVGVYIPDLLVNNRIILELKAKPFLHSEDIRQFWYYLKNSEFTLGFLINFGEPNGVRIVRRVYDLARKNLGTA